MDTLASHPTYIYALCEPSYVPVEGDLPSPDVVRYVGKTVEPRERFMEHRRARGKNHRDAWIRAVQRGGHCPVMAILEVVPDLVDWRAAEAQWVVYYRDCGAHLTNGTDHGQWAGPGLTSEALARRSAAVAASLRTPEARAKRSEISKRVWKDEDFRERTVAAIAASQRTDEARAAMREHTLSRGDGWRAKLSDAQKRRFSDEEERRTLSARIKAGKSTEAVRARHAEIMRERMADPVQKARVGAMSKAVWSDPVKKAARIENMRIAARAREAKKRAEGEIMIG